MRVGKRRRSTAGSAGPVAAMVAVFLVLAASAATPAFAKRKGGKHSAHAAAGKRVAIMSADGSQGAQGPVRAQIKKALSKNKIKVAGKSTGSPPSDDQAWMALARTLKVDGFIVPSYEGDKRKRSVEIAVRTASDGSVVKSETFTAKGAPKKLATAVGKGFWKQLGSAVEQVSSPAAGQEGTGMPARDLSRETPGDAETTKPVAEADKGEPATESAPPATESAPATEKSAGATEESAGPTDEGEAAPAEAAAPKPRPRRPSGDAVSESAQKPRALGPMLPALTLRLALRYVSRSLTYTADPALPTSSMATPTIGGAASWFPITYLGLEVAGEFASWVKYVDRYPSVTSDLTGSLVFRLPFSFGELTAHAGGFRHMLALQDDGSNTRVDQLLPDLVYLGLRAGAGLSYHLTGAFTATVEASYRLITDMNGGAYAVTKIQYFPAAVRGPGLDGALTLAYRLTSLLEIQAGFDIRRYVLSVRGNASTRIQATYATDQSLAGWVGVGGVLGGH